VVVGRWDHEPAATGWAQGASRHGTKRRYRWRSQRHGCKHGEERQAHDAAGPRYVDEQLRGQPAQTTGLYKVPLRRADGVAVDAPSVDLTSPTSLDGVIDANHHGGVGAQKGGDQQAQQPARHGVGRPYSLVEHTMIDRKVILLLPPNNTQCRRDGSLARRQDGACHQQQDVLPGRAGEKPGRAGEPRQQASWQGGLVGRWDGIVVLHPMRRIDPTEARQALVGLAARVRANWPP
jgi:hypothetical protein